MKETRREKHKVWLCYSSNDDFIESDSSERVVGCSRIICTRDMSSTGYSVLERYARNKMKINAFKRARGRHLLSIIGVRQSVKCDVDGKETTLSLGGVPVYS